MNANDLKIFFENSEIAALIADLGLEVKKYYARLSRSW